MIIGGSLAVLIYRKNIMIRKMLGRLTGRSKSGDARGDMRLRLAGGASLERDFNVIPSETSLAERMYLYFLAREMTGNGNILEVGPFLGGTTRALARGLEHSGIPDRRLVTIDQFDNYYDISKFKQFGISETGDGDKMLPFREIFEQFHRDESYFHLIDARTVKIADLPNETTDYAFMEGLDDIRAVFIDGCKSWYSVRDFVSHVVGQCEVGAYYLFQDYGRYTCFWIPAFVESFTEHFQFIGSVDSTYVYRLVKPLSKDEIASVFPEQPNGIDVTVMDLVFDRVFLRAQADLHPGAMVNCRIQAAAFHSYIGDKDKARILLKDLKRQNFVRGNLVNRVREAMVSPTYTPNEKIFL